MSDAQVTEKVLAWRKRWQETFDAAVHLLNLEEVSGGGSAKAQLLAANDDAGMPLLQRLGAQMLRFAAQQFAFLLDGLYLHKHVRFSMNFDDAHSAQKVRWRLARSMACSVDRLDAEDLGAFVLEQILRQVGEDTFLLRSLASQYKVDRKSQLGIGLRQGNGLASRVIESLKTFLPDHSNPLTYVRPFTGVRLMPYNSTPIVGFPLTSLAHPRDYLALPHELGHYLYWRGTDGCGLPFYERLFQIANEKNHSPWIRRWSQEIFADIVGALIGGPLAIHSLQEMLLKHMETHLVHDSGLHPIPAVRPLAPIVVLEQINWPNMGGNLRDDWLSKLSTSVKSKPLQIVVEEETTAHAEDERTVKLVLEEVSFDELRCELEGAANAIFGAFQPGVWSPPPDNWTPGSNVLKPDWEILYKNFSEDVERRIARNLGTDHIVESSWHTLVQPLLKSALPDEMKNSRAWAGAVLADAVPSQANLVPVPPDEWVAAAFLLPWRNAGPEGGSPHFT